MSNIEKLPIKVQGIPFCRLGDSILYLLVKRTPEDGGFRQSITGTLHSDESLIQGLTRELEEELGLKYGYILTNLLTSFTRNKSDGRLIHEFVYGVFCDVKFEPVLSSDEHDEYCWCDFETALKILGTDNNKKTLTLLHQNLLRGMYS